MSNGFFTCDSERLEFLKRLDASEDIEVTDWEAKFLESAMKWHTGAILFSDRQREVIAELFRKYGGDL